jgi:hypothetical protein
MKKVTIRDPDRFELDFQQPVKQPLITRAAVDRRRVQTYSRRVVYPDK